MEADKDKMMREYRAQLDAERARKLAHGKNHSSSKSKRKKGNCLSGQGFFCNLINIAFYVVDTVFADKKDKDSKKHGSKKRKVHTHFLFSYSLVCSID